MARRESCTYFRLDDVDVEDDAENNKIIETYRYLQMSPEDFNINIEGRRSSK